MTTGLPPKSGLYDPDLERDSCGVGFVCDIKGRASNQILRDAHQMNCAMEHRGGLGFEVNTGDGAGIMTGIPHQLFSAHAAMHLNQQLPESGKYGAGIVFLPRDAVARERCMEIVAEEIQAAAATLIGWRDVETDVDGADIGSAARAAMPVFKHLLIGCEHRTGDALERTLYTIRKRASSRIRSEGVVPDNDLFYVCSLSSRVIVYKGMVTPEQLFKFFGDLRDARFETQQRRN